MSTTNYSFDSIILNYAGVTISDYAADNDSITVEYNSDNFTKTVGNDGNVVINKNLDQTGIFRFNLMQNSKINGILSGLWNTAYNGVFSTAPISLTDLDSNTLSAAAEAWIIKIPKLTYGKEINSVQWGIECAKLQSFIGGSSL